MQLEYFIARGFARARSEQGQGIRANRLLLLSSLSVSLSLMVVLLSLAIIRGFGQEVSAVAYSQTGQLSLYDWGGNWQGEGRYTTFKKPLLDFVRERAEVEEAYPLLQQMAVLKTEDDFLALGVYGVDSAFAYSFYQRNLLEGQSLPSFSTRDSVTNPIVLPSRVVDKLGLKMGDKVRLYFSADQTIRVRSYELVAIYDSHGVEVMPALVSSQGLRRVLRLEEDVYSRLVVHLSEGSEAESFSRQLIDELAVRDDLLSGRSYAISTAEEMMPEMFQWLELLNSNVLFLIVIMLLVGAFTMITSLIIIVLDRTKQIGILKALGARDSQIQRMFAFVAMRLVLWGMMWGNVLAFTFCLVQDKYKLIPLDPSNYFMDAVPVVIEPLSWFAVNAGAFSLIFLAILGPTYIILKIKPADILRID